jgi:hypothetical protein
MEHATTQAPATPTAVPGAPADLEARIKGAKRIVVSSGMRVGRTGAMVSALGVVMTGAAFAVQTPVSSVGRVLGIAALLFGLVPFFLGWSVSKAGAPFLRALGERDAVRALLMDARPLAGGRRSLSLLLHDGTHQTVALAASDAYEVLDVVGIQSPAADRGEREAAQRTVAQLLAA